MARIASRIVGPRLVPNADTTLYTVPASTKIITTVFHIVNPTSSAVTITLSIGDSSVAANRLLDSYSVPANTDTSKGVYDYYISVPLEAAETLRAVAGTNNILEITITAGVYTLG